MAPARLPPNPGRRAALAGAAALLLPGYAPPAPRANPPYEPWMLARLAGLRQQDPGAVMLGDSLIAAWPADQVRRLFPGGAVNLGAGGDRTENVLWRVQQAFRPGMALRQALVLAGTNDLHLHPPADIAGALADIAALIHANAPDAAVTVIGILPRRDPAASAPAITEVNRRLQALPGIRYADPGTFPPDAYKDTVHLTPEGYARLTDAVLPALRG